MKDHDRVLGVLLAVAVGMGGVAAAAAESGDDPIKARHVTMEGIGEAMGSLAAIAKKEQPFDAALVAEKAGGIAKRLEKAAKLFPEGTQTGAFPTRAKTEVWSQRKGFDAGMKEAHAAAVALAGVDEEAAFMPALGRLGNACKTCHQTYRQPEE